MNWKKVFWVAVPTVIAAVVATAIGWIPNPLSKKAVLIATVVNYAVEYPEDIEKIAEELKELDRYHFLYPTRHPVSVGEELWKKFPPKYQEALGEFYDAANRSAAKEIGEDLKEAAAMVDKVHENAGKLSAVTREKDVYWHGTVINEGSATAHNVTLIFPVAITGEIRDDGGETHPFEGKKVTIKQFQIGETLSIRGWSNGKGYEDAVLRHQDGKGVVNPEEPWWKSIRWFDVVFMLYIGWILYDLARKGITIHFTQNRREE